MKEKSTSVWGIVLNVVIAVAPALAGVLGLNACMKV